MDTIFSEETFDQQSSLQPGEYENCRFVNCDLSDGNLSNYIFIDCEFTDCNLSNAKIAHTAFREVTFNGCKMLGLQFNNCNAFGLSVAFTGCTLNHSSFYERQLKKTVFSKSLLREVDFTSADLSGAKLEECDLADATFDQTNLEKADLSTSFHYIIDPQRNKIKKAKFSLEALPGLLAQYDIHITR